MPVRMSLSEGTVADCTQAHSLIEGIAAEYLLADRGYDTNAIVAEAEAQGMEPVSHRGATAKNPGTTTWRCINYVIWLRTHSWTSNNGVP